MSSVQKTGAFDQFVNLYPLSKTLRFELVPDPVSLEHMKSRFRYDSEIQAFLSDKEIEDAYKKLKPVLDKIHEQFITESLTSNGVKSIDFSEYFKAFVELKKNKNGDLTKIEGQLRKQIGDAFVSTSIDWKLKAGINSKGKQILIDTGYKILTEKGILKYIEFHADDFVDIIDKETLLKILGQFSDFFTYFSGFSQNRENYYTTKDEKETAVATRIVSVNLPKFCDNIVAFQDMAQEYLEISNYLENIGINLIDTKKNKLEPITKELFVIEHFSNCLSQQEIDIYNEKIGRINFLVNLCNQNKKSQKNEFKKLPQFKTLYKQIGCGKRKETFEQITDYSEQEALQRRAKEKQALSVEAVLHTVANAGNKYFQIQTTDGMLHSVADLVKYLKEINSFEGIYLTKTALNSISGKYFNQWDVLQKSLVKSGVFAKDKKSEDGFRIPAAVELSALFEVVNAVEDWKVSFFKPAVLKDSVKAQLIDSNTSAASALLACILSDLEQAVLTFLKNQNAVLESTDFKSAERKEVIKNWLDQMLVASQIIKYFSVREKDVKGKPLDPSVAEFIKNFFDGDAHWSSWYDLIRNFMTKKVQDRANEKANRMKLNFGNSTLADGWDINKESANSCTLFRSNNKFYLAIIAKVDGRETNSKILERNANNKLFDLIDSNSNWEKMEYYFLSGASKMIPKCSTQIKDVVKHFKVSNDDYIFPIGYKVSSGEKFLNELVISKKIFELNNRLYLKSDINVSILKDEDAGDSYIKAFQKDFGNYNKKVFTESLVQWIDFCKAFLSAYPKTRDFKYYFLPSSEYKSVDEFYNHIDVGSYYLNFVSVNGEHLNKLVNEGKIYLFQIKNQDSNDKKISGHRKNLHTLYWENIFKDVENKPKLNGSAEIFYRKALQESDLEKIKKSGKEIIKNYRFSKPKFKFHVPITLNFCKNGKYHRELIAENILTNKINTFIGIDRGEKNLAYYSVVDSSGKILCQGDLNIPFVDQAGNPRSINVDDTICHNYCDLLADRERKRDKARKSWQSISKIKDLKKGYISLVVRKIADLVVKYDAFIVLEDLNAGFKRGRQKIERSVYQQLELALAQKLNYLVQKNVSEGEIGSPTKGLQLTPFASNFGDIEKSGKQFGIMLYTRANYTSQTDPVTGWRKSIYLSPGSKNSIREQILSKFSEITFNGNDYLFEYADSIGTVWKLFSGKDGQSLKRFYNKKNRDGLWFCEEININALLDEVFNTIKHKKSIRAEIKEDSGCELDYEKLRKAIELLQQIRNFGTSKGEEDFLLSPVRNQSGEHFDSRAAGNDQPQNGDANGAYNIARKGILVAEHIRRGYKLFISDQEWDAYLAGKEIWENWLNLKENQAVLISNKKK